MNFKKTTLAVLAGVMVASGALAADDLPSTTGLGTQSQGALEISMGVSKFGDGKPGGFVMISQLDNINLGTYGISATLGKNSNFCIYASGYGLGEKYGDIKVKIGGGVDGDQDFVLTGKNTANTVNYSVKYKAGKDADANTSKTAKAKTEHSFSDLTGVSIDTNSVCLEENASIYVSVSNSAASQLAEDSYTGTLALLIAAE